jgi:hypothetical protein
VPFSSGFRPFQPYENQAAALRLFEHSLVPGLLQTEAYARAVLETHPNTAADVVEERTMDHLDDLAWRKSSYSGSNGGNCIEVAATPDTVALRDSKDPHGPVLVFGPRAWRRFADQVKAGTR